MSFTPVRLLEVSLASGGVMRPVGRLGWRRGLAYFEYVPSFLDDPLPLSPFHLAPRPGVIEGPRGLFEGLHGLFCDSLPDAWGRLLLDREMDRLGVGREQLGPLDRLARVGRGGWGALCYQPVVESGPAPSLVDLETLAADSRAVLQGDATTLYPALLALGGSSGGARPKVQVGLRPADGALWAGAHSLPAGFVHAIVKFGAREDPEDAGPVELAYANMARACGVEVASTWLLGSNGGRPGFFATLRFDRETDGARHHVHSLAGLLHADPRVPSVDYEGLLRATRWLCRDQGAVEGMFTRACFNVVAHNRDDHSRNIAFAMDSAGQWRPAPAYDLTFSPGPGGEHWMAVVGEGRSPGRAHLMELARRVGVPTPRAHDALERVREAVAAWRRHASEAGVGERSMEQVSQALVRTLAATG